MWCTESLIALLMTCKHPRKHNDIVYLSHSNKFQPPTFLSETCTCFHDSYKRVVRASTYNRNSNKVRVMDATTISFRRSVSQQVHEYTTSARPSIQLLLASASSRIRDTQSRLQCSFTLLFPSAQKSTL